MPSYTLPQTYSHTLYQSNNYSKERHWNNEGWKKYNHHNKHNKFSNHHKNNWWGSKHNKNHGDNNWWKWRNHFKGQHPQWWINRWYSQWRFVKVLKYDFQHKCVLVLMKKGHQYRVLCISNNFKWHTYWNTNPWVWNNY